jgi:hypothetical protein
MKKLILGIIILGLTTSCTLNQTQEKGIYTACLGYNSIVQATTQALATGKINVKKAVKIRNELAPFKSFCNGTQPTNSTVIINDINKAVLNASEDLNNVK